jgi:hypothetical protein
VSFATFCEILNSAVVTMHGWLKVAAFGSVNRNHLGIALMIGYLPGFTLGASGLGSRLGSRAVHWLSDATDYCR